MRMPMTPAFGENTVALISRPLLLSSAMTRLIVAFRTVQLATFRNRPSSVRLSHLCIPSLTRNVPNE
jgi:hypothetical protein